ncbi:MAG: patatin-like phospholipase family protein [Gammaproteobacteria bacterium]|nr:patatin-like phospholipase family protein [Gammaproteobacteria bacterium]
MPDPAAQSPSGPRVSLVLGSGGARGLAHIGVIDVLEEHGFRIESVVGCSMGALIGGVYAMDKLDVYRDWICALERVDVLRLMDVTFGSTGFIRGEKIIEVLRELIGDTNIEDLPVKFTAVATDLESQKEVWIDRGLLFDAIRASIAIPTVFTPVLRRGRTLVDGGLLNPVPVTPTMRDDTDLTIAVDVGGAADPAVEARIRESHKRRNNALDSQRNAIHKFVDGVIEKISDALEPDEQDDEMGLQEIMTRSFDVMQETLARHKLAAHPPDLLISVPRNVCQVFDFHLAAPLIDYGRELTERALTHLPADIRPR